MPNQDIHLFTHKWDGNMYHQVAMWTDIYICPREAIIHMSILETQAEEHD